MTISTQSTLLYFFLSGSGGYDKSNLIKTIFHAMSKVFLYRSVDPAKYRLLLRAPTRVLPVNTNGNTISFSLVSTQMSSLMVQVNYFIRYINS